MKEQEEEKQAVKNQPRKDTEKDRQEKRKRKRQIKKKREKTNSKIKKITKKNMTWYTKTNNNEIKNIIIYVIGNPKAYTKQSRGDEVVKEFIIENIKLKCNDALVLCNGRTINPDDTFNNNKVNRNDTISIVQQLKGG